MGAIVVGLYVYKTVTVRASSSERMTLVRCSTAGNKMKRKADEDVGFSRKETLNPGLYGLFSNAGIEITSDGGLTDMSIVVKGGKDPWPVPLATRPPVYNGISAADWEDFHTADGDDYLHEKFLFTQAAGAGMVTPRGDAAAFGSEQGPPAQSSTSRPRPKRRKVYAVLASGDIVPEKAALKGSRDAVNCTSTFLQERFGARLRGEILLMGAFTTVQALDAAIREAARLAKGGDSCVIVFSGHGGADPLGWWMHDGVYPISSLADALSMFDTGVEVLIVGDCCYALDIFRQFLPEEVKREWEELPDEEFMEAVRRARKEHDPRYALLRQFERSLVASIQPNEEGSKGADLIFGAGAGFGQEFPARAVSKFMRALADQFPPVSGSDPVTYDELSISLAAANATQANEAWILFAPDPPDMGIRPLRT